MLGGSDATRSSGGGWAAGAPIVGAGVTKSIPPVLVPLEGASDLLVLFADNSADKVIRHAVRPAGTKAWSAVQNTGALAFAPGVCGDAAVAVVPSGVATKLVRLRGTSQVPPPPPGRSRQRDLIRARLTGLRC